MASTTIMSLDEFRRMPESQPDGTFYELDEGELIRVSPGGSKHSVVVQRISHYLETLIDPQVFTIVSGEVGFELGSNTVRGADIAILAEAIDLDTLPDGYFTRPPAVAIEVVGAKHDAEQLERKINQYLTAGVQEVWAIYIKSRRTYIYRGAKAEVIEPGQKYFSTGLNLSIDTRFFFLRHTGRE
jgi:Uma2 family endonuclease